MPVAWPSHSIVIRTGCMLQTHLEYDRELTSLSLNKVVVFTCCRFTKSVIKSQAALTYAEAQSRIDDERLHDTLSTNLRIMNRVAKILRRRRTERQASLHSFLHRCLLCCAPLHPPLLPLAVFRICMFPFFPLPVLSRSLCWIMGRQTAQ